MSDRTEAATLIHTSVQDALSSAGHRSMAVVRLAIELEEKRSKPRVALIRGLRAEIRRKERLVDDV